MFLPPILNLAFFRPALRQRPATEEGFRLRDIAEKNIRDVAKWRLEQSGQPITDEILQNEIEALARLREKYS
jgi:hypothetical protein